MKTWYLVEEFDPDTNYTDKGVLALTPEAAYRLNKFGIKYSIVEDFYEEEKLMQDEENYFYEQLQWFDKFDRLLKDCITYCKQEDICLARAHFYRLKCFIDSLIIYSYIFTKFIENTKPGNILYFRINENSDSDYSIYSPFDKQKNIIPHIIKCICEKQNIPFTMHSIENNQPIIEAAPLFFVRIKNILKRLHLNSLYYFFKYKKFAKFLNAKKPIGINILTLHAGCLSIDAMIKDLIGTKCTVFLKNSLYILRISSIFQKKILDLSLQRETSDIFRKRKEEADNAYKKFLEEGNLIRWISDKCGFGVTEIIAPYFKDFIKNICVQNIIEIPQLQDFYEKENIDFVMARASSEKEVISSLLAAAKKGKRVCFQHSCGAFESKRDNIIELSLFDYYFSMHDEAEKHMNLSLKNDYLGSCRVFQAPYHLKAVKERWAAARRDKNLVMYIPTKLFFGFRSYNGYLYPLTWYFEFQKSLIDLFSTKKELQFIFKYAPGQEWSRNSILLYIKDKRFNNISIESRPMSECLGRVGRVILDFPSTSLYEVAAAGIPVMSLCYDILEIRDLSLSLFGRSLQKFHDIPEALKIVNDFLAQDPEEFKVNIPMSDENVLNILKKINRRMRNEDFIFLARRTRPT